MKYAILMIAAVALSLAACQRRESEAAPVPAPAQSVEIKPEMLVHWDGSANVFCLTRTALAEFVGHSARGEETKGLAMIGGAGPCRVMGDPHATGKVLSMTVLDSGVPVVELAPAGSGVSDGFWTLQANLLPGAAP